MVTNLKTYLHSHPVTLYYIMLRTLQYVQYEGNLGTVSFPESKAAGA
jgi:hypothetical protein